MARAGHLGQHRAGKEPGVMKWENGWEHSGSTERCLALGD